MALLLALLLANAQKVNSSKSFVKRSSFFEKHIFSFAEFWHFKNTEALSPFERGAV
jgi:hypothetical protein